MALPPKNTFHVICENGHEGTMSGDAFGITVMLYVYSHMSFCSVTGLARTCGEQYHLLRDYMFEHREVRQILAAID